jgi:hypothetical protein
VNWRGLHDEVLHDQHSRNCGLRAADMRGVENTA